MSSAPTRIVAPATVLEGYIQAQVATGLHSNGNEMVRAGLPLLMERDRAMRRTEREGKARPAR